MDIVFLAHRIPYPPEKGDKIRAWNVLQHLTARHRVHLATFIDAPDDVRWVEHLERVCASVLWRPLSPRRATLRSLSGLLSGAALTEGYFGDRRLHAAIEGVLARYSPSLIYVFSSAMAPYVPYRHSARVIIDLVDVDSEKWRQYAASSTGLARWLYAREGRALLALERRAARAADAVLFVSDAEAELFKRLAPEAACRTHGITNGVDAAFFRPVPEVPNPVGDRPAIVFTGAMDYRPNAEAMIWFVGQVMPRLRGHRPVPRLWIVGANPGRVVRALAGPDVCVTGRVPDVRPYLHHARAVVAPLQIARGIQNKVLEAMAMGAAVVATPQAREGLDRCRSDELLTAATPAAFAEALLRILNGEGEEIGKRARARVALNYRWQDSLDALDRLVNTAMGEPAAPDWRPGPTPVHAPA